MRLKNRVVVVTGASSGIGRATAKACAAAGSTVVLTARREDALRAAADECASAGADTLVVPADVTDADAVENVARRAVEQFGRIDVWVNNAAVTVFGPFLDTPLDEFRRVIDVNVMGYVHGARAALPSMKEQGQGAIVNVSSVVGHVAQPYTHAYGMSKFAIRALAVSLRQELRIDGYRRIRVSTVLPPTIDTPLFQHAANHTGREAVAMPPVYTPERVARAIINTVRLPRREVPVGPMARQLLMESKLAPGVAERMMAFQVERSHLSRHRPYPESAGNLFEPASGHGSVHGTWHGRRRTAVRRAVTAGLMTGGAVAVARRTGAFSS